MWHLMSVSSEHNESISHNTSCMAVSSCWTMILNLTVEITLQSHLVIWSSTLIQCWRQHTIVSLTKRSSGTVVCSWISSFLGLHSLMISVKNSSCIFNQKRILKSNRSWTVKFNVWKMISFFSFLKFWFLFLIHCVFISKRLFSHRSSNWTMIVHGFIKFSWWWTVYWILNWRSLCWWLVKHMHPFFTFKIVNG